MWEAGERSGFFLLVNVRVLCACACSHEHEKNVC